jgi:putative nucleotidyltransferase with HDIG domain
LRVCGDFTFKGFYMASIFLLHKDRLVLELMATVLRGRGHLVHEAQDLATGAGVVATMSCDLAILDVTASHDGWNGLAALRDRSCRRDMALLMIAATAQAEQVRAAGALGARGFIVGSQCTMENFFRQIDRVLAGAARPAPRPQAAASAATGAPKPEVAVAAKPAAPAQAQRRPLTTPGPEPSVGDMLRGLAPLITPPQLRAKLSNAFEVRALSATVARVLELTRTTAVSADTVANAIKCDQAIALRVIKLANSAVYQRGDRVNTVKAAVLRIGMQQIQQAVQNLGVMERFSGVSMDTYLNHVLFWEHSLGTGIIAAQLGASLGMDSDAAFTMGLLHDVGRMLLAEAMPDEYLKVLITSRDAALPLEQVEKRMLTTTHAEIMLEVLQSWNFPKHLSEPIACHQASAGLLREACAAQFREAAVLALADRLAHAMLLGCSGSSHVADVTELCELLELPEATVDRLVGTAARQTQDLKLAMLSNAAETDLITRAQELRGQFGGDFRPLFVNGGQKPDAYQILCKHLADPGGGTPTVAVVHVRTAREKSTLSVSLASAERAAKARGLPLIVISPSGQWGLDDAGSRPCVMLPEPVSTVRFAGAVKKLQPSARAMAA